MRLFSLLLCLSISAFAQELESTRSAGGPNADRMNPATFSSLRFRAIGTVTIDPKNPSPSTSPKF